MLTAFARRLRSQTGQAQLALTAVVAVLAVVVAAVATVPVATGASVRANPRTQARALLAYAAQTAQRIAVHNGGSYADVCRLELHKVGGVTFSPSANRPWVSAASGTTHTFRITVRVEPGGGSYTLTRSAGGATQIAGS